MKRRKWENGCNITYYDNDFYLINKVNSYYRECHRIFTIYKYKLFFFIYLYYCFKNICCGKDPDLFQYALSIRK